MRPLSFAAFVASSSLTLANVFACAATPSAGAKAQEAATELNINARFGRMGMAIERVAASDREGFTKRHQGWGGKVRIADIELAGVKPKSESEAEVNVRVAWYRPEEQELRQTTLKQIWKAPNGEWLLVREERLDGDVGLIGEKTAVTAPPGPRQNAQFPTIRIGASDSP